VKEVCRLASSPPPQDAVPEWYRADGAIVPRGETFLPERGLWVSLRGGNGRFCQLQAQQEWRRQCIERSQAEEQVAIEEAERRRLRAEEMQKRREETAELKLRVEAALEEKRRRLELEERLRAEREERERLKRLEEERQWLLRQPRPCKVCRGDRRCGACHGIGLLHKLYLSPTVNVREEADSSFGRLPTGCSACGGSGDDAGYGPLVLGSGKCVSCQGSGWVAAPLGGWPG